VDRKLTPKQQRFVDFYDGNATQAAEKAGYKHPRQVGSENLSKPYIQAALKVRETERNKKTIADREERQEFWTTTFRDDEVALRDRLRASELLGKSEADFIERLNVGGPDGGPIETILTEVAGATRGLPNTSQGKV